MNLFFKKTLSLLFFGTLTLLATTTNAQSNCGSNNTETLKKTADIAFGDKLGESTSGCSPSSCRGAQTKFGEAKVISNLRSNLVSLKADMEKSNHIKFDARSYDIHGIVGESDDESLRIIVREISLIEKEFLSKTEFKFGPFSLPESKAKQITYLANRINTLKKFL